VTGRFGQTGPTGTSQGWRFSGPELAGRRHRAPARPRSAWSGPGTPARMRSVSRPLIRHRSGRRNAQLGGQRQRVSGGLVRVGGPGTCRTSANRWLPFPASPTNRNPLRAIVRIRRCSWPLSPMALRAASIWLASVDSETIGPPHNPSSSSSLLTTRTVVPEMEQQDLRPDRNRLGAPLTVLAQEIPVPRSS
jgi:hypothetical protein